MSEVVRRCTTTGSHRTLVLWLNASYVVIEEAHDLVLNWVVKPGARDNLLMKERRRLLVGMPQEDSEDLISSPSLIRLQRGDPQSPAHAG